MTHGSLFSGIGGFDLAAQWMGWENVFHVERDPFCQQVLRHHFPKSKSHEDIKEFDGTAYAGRVDIISGGFPCQPFSAAGKRAGTSDDRYLWPEMFRIIREARPTYVVAENVRGLLSWNEGLVLDTVCSDLESEGYEVCPVLLPAASVNAPHRRDRIWIVAHAFNCKRASQGQGASLESIRGHNAKQSQQWQQSSLLVDRSFGLAQPAPNANDKGGAGGPRQVQGTNGEISQRDDHAQPCHPGAADATNANALRLQQRTDSREVGRGQSEVRREGNQFAEPIEATRAAWNATNTYGAGERQDHRKGESGQPHQKSPPRNWQDFPTVAPICGGDDGLPERLDGITFPKWRRESIKAYGNAIVPQVALQIFKAIQQGHVEDI